MPLLRADAPFEDPDWLRGACLDPHGRSNFYDLLFRREWPYVLAFDLLSVDGEDLRDSPAVACIN